MAQQAHSKEEVLGMLNKVPVATVATAAGEKVRTRMMHFAADEDFSIYLATMKGDPKTLQLTHHPFVSLLVHEPGADINDSREVEIEGSARFVRDDAQREKALKLTAQRSPVVQYLTSTGNAGLLDCLQVVPETVKYRVFKEIVQGMPPTVLEFPQNKPTVSEWTRLRQKLHIWYVNTRVPFLTAALVPVLLGTALAWFAVGGLHWGFFLLTLIAGLAMHAGTNVINDFFDYKSHNDDINREFIRPFSGGSRTIQLGLTSPLETLMLALFYFGIAIVLGLVLAWTRGWPILALGIVGTISGFFYTGYPFKWAHRGVGELVVGLNFGPLMALGAYYVQTQQWSWTPAIAAIPVGLLIAAVLYINEFPDFTADKAVGKRTLVVRLGKRRAVGLYALMVAGVVVSIVLGVALGALPAAALLGLLPMPLLVRATAYAYRHYASPFDMAPANGLTIVVHLAVGLLLALAYVWAGAGNGGLSYVVPLGVLCLAFIGYMYWQMEKGRKAFVGLKQVVK